MKFIFTSYVGSPEYDQPEKWLKRIEAYTGILEALGSSDDVIGIERINYHGEFTQNGVHYYFFNLKRKVVWFPWRLNSLVKNLRPDVVFINGLIFPLQVIQLHFRLGKKVKIIVLHRAEKPFSGLKGYLQKLADKYIDAYLFSSLEFIEDWKHNINKEKVYEIVQASSVFQPVNKMQARQQTGANGSPVFLWVGRLDANKDPLTVVNAFLKYSKHQPGGRLYLIYQEEKLLEEVKKQIAADENNECPVILVGNVRHDEMQWWYSSADFIISSSHYEGSGIAVSEGMSCGCIPIVTDIPSFRGMTGQGKCGFMYRPGNEQELLDVLLKSNKIDRDAERLKSLEQFRKELSFGAIAGKITGIINSFSTR